MSDTEDLGDVVVVLNQHGVAVAFGPYLDEGEAHEVAEFACRLLPTWLLHLDENAEGAGCFVAERYGLDSTGTDLETPEAIVVRPTRAKGLPLPRETGPAR